MGLIPTQGTKILHATWHGQKKKMLCKCLPIFNKNVRIYRQMSFQATILSKVEPRKGQCLTFLSTGPIPAN